MYSSTLPSTHALDGGGWSKPGSGRFTPRKYPVPIVAKQERILRGVKIVGVRRFMTTCKKGESSIERKMRQNNG
jgi:hypothetical protein